jgi:glycosyltransferase involved in cell wall biosynthesis
MRVSVILSTYNAPDWLERVIWGYSVQSHRDFELLIADDGSTPETRRRIDGLRRRTRLAIRHLWHERRGFRKCTIVNRAIQAAESEYLVFSDGDCVPRFDFLQQHVALAEPGHYLSGGAIRLPLSVSGTITRESILSRRFADPMWLRFHGLKNTKKLIILRCGAKLSRLLDAVTPTKPTWNGGNASAWTSDILRVNGYDERMEHGGLDRELGERLVNAGVRPKQVRHRAICLHLDHSRTYVTDAAIEQNRHIRRQTRQGHAVWTSHGIRKAA